MKAVCIGHSTYDTTLPVNEFPTENIKTRIDGHIECGGGPAANGGYLLSKWGLDTSIVSIVGNDYYGDRIIEEFKGIGADTTYIEKVNNHYTSSSYIIANKSNGSRTIITSKDKPILRISKKIDLKPDVILVDGEHPETAEEVLKENPDAISILDAGRLNDSTRKLGKLSTYVICSHDFAEEFTNMKTDVNNIDDLIKIYEKLKEFYKTNIIITLEEKGSFTEINGKYKIIPSIKVKAIDSTGAGDIFHGAFVYFISQKYSLEQAIRYASITAALSVTKLGARYSIPELKEVLEYDDII